MSEPFGFDTAANYAVGQWGATTNERSVSNAALLLSYIISVGALLSDFNVSVTMALCMESDVY